MFYEQEVCGRSPYLMKKSKIATWLPMLRDNAFSFQRTEIKEIENGFLGQSYDTPQGNEYVYPLNKIVI